MWFFLLLIISETIKFPATANISVKSFGTEEKNSVDAFEVVETDQEKTKELVPKDSKDMSALRNKSISTISLHLLCFWGAVLTVDLPWKKEGPKQPESKLKSNWYIPGLNISWSQQDFKEDLKFSICKV